MASEPQPAWKACRFDTVPLTAIGLPMDEAIRLYALGLRTVADVDALIADYREKDLYRLVGRKDGRRLMKLVTGFCRRRLLETIQRMNAES